jgi:formamidopyrimidine-DNA glycosylase
MPELPEVETICRDLRPVLVGQKVKEARFLNAAIREPASYKSANILKGKRLERIDRRGKNIIFRFSDELAMICHLKMTGRLIIEQHDAKRADHLHFFINFEKDNLEFFDIRKFGRICILKKGDVAGHPRLGRLGPEPFEISSAEFITQVKRRNKAIKLVLLDQEVIAGIGNIYADESLFMAGIRPTSKPSRISGKRLERLLKTIIEVLQEAISNRGTSVDDYLDGYGRRGNFQRLLRAYGKTGEQCPNCGSVFKRIVLGGRSTHYCPKCQK